MTLSLNQVPDLMGFTTPSSATTPAGPSAAAAASPPERDTTASRQHGNVSPARAAPLIESW